MVFVNEKAEAAAGPWVIPWTCSESRARLSEGAVNTGIDRHGDRDRDGDRQTDRSIDRR